MRSFLVLVGFAIGIVGYAIVYDGAAALATAGSGGPSIPWQLIPIPGLGKGAPAKGTKTFPWGRPGIINSLIPGRESQSQPTGAGQIAPSGGGTQPLAQVRYV